MPESLFNKVAGLKAKSYFTHFLRKKIFYENLKTRPILPKLHELDEYSTEK